MRPGVVGDAPAFQKPPSQTAIRGGAGNTSGDDIHRQLAIIVDGGDFALADKRVVFLGHFILDIVICQGR